MQPEIFYDVASLHVNGATIDEYANATASSAGVGFYLQVSDVIKAWVALAKPLSIQHAPDVERGWQSLFNVTAIF